MCLRNRPGVPLAAVRTDKEAPLCAVCGGRSPFCDVVIAVGAVGALVRPFRPRVHTTTNATGAFAN